MSASAAMNAPAVAAARSAAPGRKLRPTALMVELIRFGLFFIFLIGFLVCVASTFWCADLLVDALKGKGFGAPGVEEVRSTLNFLFIGLEVCVASAIAWAIVDRLGRPGPLARPSSPAGRG